MEYNGNYEMKLVSFININIMSSYGPNKVYMPVQYGHVFFGNISATFAKIVVVLNHVLEIFRGEPPLAHYINPC